MPHTHYDKKRGRGDPPAREHVPEKEKTRGFRRREQELTDLEEAGEAGSTQGKVRLGGARRALERQEHIIRLRRKRRPTA